MKQKVFAEKYLELHNATEAADQVYNCKNRNVAGVIGWENLRKPKVIAVINLILEAKEGSLVSVATAFKRVIEKGTPTQQLRAIEVYLKAIGAY